MSGGMRQCYKDTSCFGKESPSLNVADVKKLADKVVIKLVA